MILHLKNYFPYLWTTTILQRNGRSQSLKRLLLFVLVSLSFCLLVDRLTLIRCRHTLSRMPMGNLNTWKALTRVLLVERRYLYGSTVVFYFARNCNALINPCGSATPNHIHQGQFVLDVTAKVLPIYESLFDIEYPLPKLDTLGKDIWLKVIFVSLTARSCGRFCIRRHGENSFG
jgi:hypothetical protein